MDTEPQRDAIRNIIMSDVAHRNLGAAQLLEHAVRRQEGLFSKGGAYVVRTGQFTGRSPKDKFIVRDDLTESTVQWGPVNQPMSEASFDRLWAKMLAQCQGHDLFVEDCFAGADPRYALPLRVLTQYAWHALFARQLFVRPDPPAAEHTPEFTLFFVPRLQASIEDGAASETCIVINFTKRVVLICGTSYAGEMKKAVFTILNYLLPARNIMPMHCSCNVGQGGDVALFFGLSGTGKTTLSADPNRRLIGDDEHGWSDEGVFNFEGGCYAKCIHLSAEKEPQIWNAIRFGTVLENVAMDSETRLLDFDSSEVTENSRAAYPISFIDNAVIPSVGGHPTNIILLPRMPSECCHLSRG
jgi:phosphoenolpyruvate carboxykinase (ATP)